MLGYIDLSLREDNIKVSEIYELKNYWAEVFGYLMEQINSLDKKYVNVQTNHDVLIDFCELSGFYTKRGAPNYFKNSGEYSYLYSDFKAINLLLVPSDSDECLLW
jgi:hypothetical protein